MHEATKFKTHKKKVIVINTKYKNFGGEDSNILEELKLLNDKYEVEYLEFDNNSQLNFSTICSFLLSYNYRSNSELDKKLKEFKPDIAYVHNTWFRGGLGLFSVLQRNNIKIFLKLHNFRFDCSKNFLIKNHIAHEGFCKQCGLERKRGRIFNKYFQESYIKSLALITYGKKYHKILSRTDLNLIVLNKFQKNYLLNQKFKNNIAIINNPVNFQVKELSFDKFQKKDVVYAGLINSSKGLPELLETWTKSEVTNLNLKIIGAGPLKNILEKKYSSSNIKFLDIKTNRETLEIIKNSRAVITATRMYEVQPRLLCEASSFAVPSIFPNFGGMSEYFPYDYKFSFEQYDYNDLSEKINLLNDENLLTQESKKVYEFINHNLSNKKTITDMDSFFFGGK